MCLVKGWDKGSRSEDRERHGREERERGATRVQISGKRWEPLGKESKGSQVSVIPGMRLAFHRLDGTPSTPYREGIEDEIDGCM